MYPGHLDDANRLIYAFINGICAACVVRFFASSGIILTILMGIGFIVNLYIFVGKVLAKHKSWGWLFASGLVTAVFFMGVLLGLHKIVTTT